MQSSYESHRGFKLRKGLKNILKHEKALS